MSRRSLFGRSAQPCCAAPVPCSDPRGPPRRPGGAALSPAARTRLRDLPPAVATGWRIRLAPGRWRLQALRAIFHQRTRATHRSPQLGNSCSTMLASSKEVFSRVDAPPFRQLPSLPPSFFLETAGVVELGVSQPLPPVDSRRSLVAFDADRSLPASHLALNRVAPLTSSFFNGHLLDFSHPRRRWRRCQ